LGNFLELRAADGHTFRAYSTGAPNQARGLVMCHEYSGLNRVFRLLADQIAALGFHVIAPDLFARAETNLELRYSPQDRARGREAAAKLPPAQTMLDVGAAIMALGEPSIAILGYDFGANVAWHAAGTLRGLRAAVCFYGEGIADARQEAPLCPVQLHWAEYDEVIPATHPEAIRRAQPQVAMEFYPGATHGFLCAEQESFRCETAETARDNTLAFLRHHMAGASQPIVLPTAAVAPTPLRRPIEAPAAPVQAEAPVGLETFGRGFGFGRRAVGY
jgi:carboxymethylenebutenolidase